MQKKALIVDLDGTLYYQRPVQICIGLELLIYYLFHFWRIKELKQILIYRHQHNTQTNFDIRTFCKQQKTDIKTIQSLVQKWLFLKPLKWIKIFADKNLIYYLKEKQKSIPVVIYSDYETKEKLNALNFKPNFKFSYDGTNIRYLKPNPQGLTYIANNLNLLPENILIIGDRFDKDGLAASAFGSEFLILPQNPIARRKITKKLKHL